MSVGFKDQYDGLIEDIKKDESIYSLRNDTIHQLDVLCGYLFVLSDLSRVEGRSGSVESSLADINTALSVSVAQLREVLATSLEGEKDDAVKHIKKASRRTFNALEKLEELVNPTEED